MAWHDGITHIVATPHSNDQYPYDRQALQETLDKLMEMTGGKPALSLGCDFHFSFDNIQNALANPGHFTIGRTPYLLLEFSDFSLPPNVDDLLAKFINIGLRPIITHPERNPILRRTPQRVIEWVRGGVLMQVTANALTNRWGQKARAMAKWLLEQGAVHVLATDAHGVDSRPPILSAGREEARKIAGEAVAEMLVQGNPCAILAGEEVPYRPKI